MIVKNESAIIERCLKSVYHLIDSYCIVDTGSTDNTQEIIKKVLKDKPGVLHSSPFINFGHNRNEAIQLASPLSDWILCIDADMTLSENGFNKNTLDPNVDAYSIFQQNGTLRYTNMRLLNSKQKWTCVGVTHEYYSCVGKSANTATLSTLLLQDHPDGGCKENKFQRDILLLEKGLIDEPNNARYMFYLAQSYKDIGNNVKAIEWYKNRIRKGGWDEEVWYSHYMIGLCLSRNKASWEQISMAYSQAHLYRPQRSEPLVELAREARNRKLFPEAYKAASLAVMIPFPNDTLFVNTDFYLYAAQDELAIAAYFLGKYKESYRINNDLLKNPQLPLGEVERIYQNRKFAEQKLAEDKNIEIPQQIKSLPNLVFYVGYIEFPSTPRGSEIALLNLAKQLSLQYCVHICGPSVKNYQENGINFSPNIPSEVDTLIISRYIHYFLEHTPKARKVILWLHDVGLQHFWEHKALPQTGKHLLENTIESIDAIVTLSDWHKGNVLKLYSVPEEKVHVIGYGLQPSIVWERTTQSILQGKVKNTFAWLAAPERGLQNFLNYFPSLKKLPVALKNPVLNVFADTKNITNPDPSCIIFHPICDNEIIHKVLANTDYFLYPTHFHETFCLSALEAQRAGCCVVTSSVGALSSTVQKGVKLLLEPNTNEFWEEVTNTMYALNNNDKINENKIILQMGAIEYAKTQTWGNKTQEWLKLL